MPIPMPQHASLPIAQRMRSCGVALFHRRLTCALVQVSSIGVVDNARSSVVRTVEQQASAAVWLGCFFPSQ